MKVLIAGGSGLVGRCLSQTLQAEGIPVVSTYNSRPIPGGQKVSFEDEVAVEALLKEVQPTVCVNCIVQRYTDVCESNWDETKRANIEIPTTLARVCERLGIFLIHISTDYVFDGSNAPYTIYSAHNPLQNYGISKHIAELRVKANCKRSCIVRVPVLYWDAIEFLEETAVTGIGKKVLNQIQPSREDNDSIRRPVFIPDLCAFLTAHCKWETPGTFHFYNTTGAYTKYQIAKMIGDYLGMPTIHIRPADAAVNVASRPYDTQLIDHQYSITTFPQTPLSEGIARCFAHLKHPRQFGPDCLCLFDLDGTLLDTDRVQYEAYRDALNEKGINLLWSEFDSAIHTSSLEAVLAGKGLSDADMKQLKERKTELLLQSTDIQPILGAEEFVKFCAANGTNMVVVTNTSRVIAEHYKKHVPFLQLIPNWICREDYGQPKPSADPYRVAIERFSKGERFRIGFENTWNGIRSLEQNIRCIYAITDPAAAGWPQIKKKDVICIPNFEYFWADTWSKDTSHKSN